MSHLAVSGSTAATSASRWSLGLSTGRRFDADPVAQGNNPGAAGGNVERPLSLKHANLHVSCFEFDSYFELRISDLLTQDASLVPSLD